LAPDVFAKSIGREENYQSEAKKPHLSPAFLQGARIRRDNVAPTSLRIPYFRDGTALFNEQKT
jgi:hypothetical protein